MRYVRRFVPVLVIASACLPPATSGAASLCSEPLKPICIDENTTYQDESTVVRCRTDLERYEQQTAAYVECLEQTIRDSEKGIEKARNEFEERARR